MTTNTETQPMLIPDDSAEAASNGAKRSPKKEEPSRNVKDDSTPKDTKKKRAGNNTKRAGSSKVSSDSDDGKSGRRVQRNFPACTFEEALEIPNAIQTLASGHTIRRLTLFDELGRSAESSSSRQTITNSGRYGLTTGGYQAEHISLTPDGDIATNPETSAADRLRARFRLAVENVPPFKLLYERFKGKLPSQSVMRDFLVDNGYSKDEVSECIDTFVLNAKFLGLLREIAGAERLLPLEHVLEELPKGSPVVEEHPSPQAVRIAVSENRPASTDVSSWDQVCFYITPIGEDGSDQRHHSDLFLNHIVEPALQEFKLKVIRADKIGKPGMISAQIIQHVIRSRIVVADLSFHNPNVFYELSLRHACCLPAVQIIRANERIPFDLKDFNTIPIDTSSIYSLVPKLETYRSEIANQVRRALNNSEAVENPINTFCPGIRVQLPPLSTKSASHADAAPAETTGQPL